MKAQLIIGVILTSVAAILLGISLPVLFLLDNCVHLPNGGKSCAIGPASLGMELPLAVFGISFAIGGIGFLVLYRLEKPQVKEKADV